MKERTPTRIKLFSFFLIIFSFNVSAQTMCGTVDEGQTLTLTAPVGNVFTSVTFASYGTPNGSCGSFTIGGCHAANSLTIVQAALIGNNSGSIPATNGTFGDPCGGTFKRLYVEAVYGSVLPLKILSFTGTAHGSIVVLKWETTDEINTRQFDIERSDNGISFFAVGTVIADNRAGNNNYSFTDNVLQAGTHFYRLKMLDLDGHYTLSKIIRLSNYPDDQLLISPNPATDLVSLSGLRSGGIIEMLNIQGEVLRRIHITAQTQTVNITGYPVGIYIIKYIRDQETTLQKIVKR